MDIVLAVVAVVIVYILLTTYSINLWFLLLAIVIVWVLVALYRRHRYRDDW